MKKNIIIIFGGKSSEHDISVITGIQTIKNINRDFFNAFPLYISKGGVFYFGEKLEDISTFINFNPKQKGIYPATFISGKPFLLTKKWFGYTAPLRVDCAIICCHGLNGEDGTISGLLDISCIPYSCSNTLSCATCMDKIIMKDIFKANNFKIVNHTFTIKSKFIENSENELVRICATVKFPQIVKPTNLGSSIGISKCKNKVELFSAITLALKYDDRVVVEEMVENLMEVNCAVKGTTEKCEASLLEQPLSYDEILTFKEKYLDSKKLSEKEVKEENEID
ncbi:MAG: D-alanine--D-alanine ligase, partial [Clostridia bacterium]